MSVSAAAQVDRISDGMGSPPSATTLRSGRSAGPALISDHSAGVANTCEAFAVRSADARSWMTKARGATQSVAPPTSVGNMSPSEGSQVLADASSTRDPGPIPCTPFLATAE